MDLWFLLVWGYLCVGCGVLLCFSAQAGPPQWDQVFYALFIFLLWPLSLSVLKQMARRRRERELRELVGTTFRRWESAADERTRL